MLTFSTEYVRDSVILISAFFQGKKIGFIRADLIQAPYEKLHNLFCADNVFFLLRNERTLRGSVVSLLIVSGSFLEPEFLGLGYGVKLYRKMMSEGFRKNNGKSLIFMPDECEEGSTTLEAKRVWASLRRRFGSSGNCIAVVGQLSD